MSSVSPYMLEWERCYSSDNPRHKNRYPSEIIVSYVYKKYSSLVETETQNSIKILDIGCGWGNNLRFFLEQGFDAYGIDNSKVAINALKSEFKERVKLADALKLPFKDEQFDLVVDRSSIQHNEIGHIRKIIKEIYRILHPGGRFFSTMVKSGSNDFRLTQVDEQALSNILAPFIHGGGAEINTQTTTKNNGQHKHVVWMIDAQKQRDVTK